MNWVDLIIIVILGLFALESMGKPFIIVLWDLLGFLTSLFISLKFYNILSEQLEKFFSLPHSLANVLSFIISWYLIEIMIFLFARILVGKLKDFGRFPSDTVISVVPALLRGFIFLSVILVLIATFPIQPRLKKEVDNSKLGSFILAKTYQLESPLKNVFGGLANDTLTFLTIRPQSQQKVNLGFTNSEFFYDENLEEEMVKLVNQERVSRGSKPLIFRLELREVGRRHSADMFVRGYFAHYSPEGLDVADRASALGINFLVIGENLAYAPTLQAAHNGLINSPGHRANILSEDYHKIGIGIANTEGYGMMITQVFSN